MATKRKTKTAKTDPLKGTAAEVLRTEVEDAEQARHREQVAAFKAEQEREDTEAKELRAALLFGILPEWSTIARETFQRLDAPQLKFLVAWIAHLEVRMRDEFARGALEFTEAQADAAPYIDRSRKQ